MPRRTGADETPAPAHARSAASDCWTQYLVWIAAHNFSEDTVNTRRACLGYFLDWCQERGLESQEITRPMLERYQRSLYHYRKSNGAAADLPHAAQPAAVASRACSGGWPGRTHLLHNPASEIGAAAAGEPPAEVHAQRGRSRAGDPASPTSPTPEGLRDRAILETFYSTGMRRMEVRDLKLYDIDAERGTVMIRQGKGKKDRMIPIGERALAWIEKYIREASRPQLLAGGAKTARCS